jgi:hypothetical protein
MTGTGLSEAERDDYKKLISTSAHLRVNRQTFTCEDIFENGYQVGVQQYPDKRRRRVEGSI